MEHFLFKAVKENDSRAIGLIFNKVNIDQETKNDGLILACEKGNLNIVKFLLQRGADIHADNYYDARERYIRTGDYSDIDNLLFISEIVNSKHLGDMPLIKAVKNNHYYLVDFLLQNGADIHAQDNLALIKAIHENNLQMIKLLFSHGINIGDNLVDPLNVAILTESVLPIIEFLVENGADLHYENDIILDSALLMGDLRVIDYLVRKGANVNFQGNERILESLIGKEKREIIKYLLSHGLQIKNQSLYDQILNLGIYPQDYE